MHAGLVDAVARRGAAPAACVVLVTPTLVARTSPPKIDNPARRNMNCRMFPPVPREPDRSLTVDCIPLLIWLCQRFRNSPGLTLEPRDLERVSWRFVVILEFVTARAEGLRALSSCAPRRA